MIPGFYFSRYKKRKKKNKFEGLRFTKLNDMRLNTKNLQTEKNKK